MTMAFCHLCEPTRPIPLLELADHLLAEHDVDMADAARWPDGELVVIDSTLEPEDFTP